MGFGKALGYGLLIFLGFNVILGFLSMFLLGIDPVSSALGNLAYRFQSFFSEFIPTASEPLAPLASTIFVLSGYAMVIYGLNFHLEVIYLDYIAEGGTYSGAYIAMISPIISIALYCMLAVIIGYLAHHPLQGFAAFFLVIFIGYSLAMCALLANGGNPLGLIIQTYQNMLINGLAFGAIAMAFGYKFEE